MTESKKALYKKDQALGEGHFGQVTQYLPIDEKGRGLKPTDPLTALKKAKAQKVAEKLAVIAAARKNQPIAVKTAKTGESSFQAEINHIKQAGTIHLFAHSTAISDENYYATEVIPGQRLNQCYERIQKLSFVQKTQLMLQLVAQLQDLHRRGLLHNDIKPHNIHVDIDFRNRNKPKCNIYLLDLGLAVPANESPEDYLLEDDCIDEKSIPSLLEQLTKGQISKFNFKGNIYHPPETLEAHARKRTMHYSTYADIYTLVNPLLMILGIADPIAAKTHALQQPQREFKDDHFANAATTQFTFKSNKFLGIPVIILDNGDTLHSILENFINRMQNNDYRKRPNDMEVLTFFSLLHKFALYHELPSPQREMTEKLILAELAAIADDKWSPEETADEKVREAKDAPKDIVGVATAEYPVDNLGKIISGRNATGFFATSRLSKLYTELEKISPATTPRASWSWQKKAVAANLALLCVSGIGIIGGYEFAPKRTEKFLFQRMDINNIGEIPVWAIAVSAVVTAMIVISIYFYYTRPEPVNDKQVQAAPSPEKIHVKRVD